MGSFYFPTAWELRMGKLWPRSLWSSISCIWGATFNVYASDLRHLSGWHCSILRRSRQEHVRLEEFFWFLSVKLQQARVCGAGAESAACLLLVFVFTILAVMDSVQLERVVAPLPLNFVVSKIQDLCFLLRTTANCLENLRLCFRSCCFWKS